MEPVLLADELATPLQAVGAAFYFEPGTAAAAEALGLNVYEFYGLGRAGVMGDPTSDEVAEAFYFFHPRTIRFLYEKATEKASASKIAPAHVGAAYDFARRTLGGIDPASLLNFGESARRVASSSRGQCPLVDGYLAFGPTGDPSSDAYLGAILMRELRGGLHIRAVVAEGLSPSEACLLEGDGIFRLHGYGDEDVVEVTDELREKKARAEATTSELVAGYLNLVAEKDRQLMVEVARAMHLALASPVESAVSPTELTES